MLAQDATIRLRLMTEQDLPMLHDWLSRPHIVEWWGGERPTPEQVRHDYMPSVLARQWVTPYIATLDGEPFQTDPSPSRIETIVTPDGPAVYMQQCKPTVASGGA